jgi:AcrR family transcriptional regulator
VAASSAKTKAAARRNGTRGPANTEALLAAAHRLVLERGENFTTQDLIKEADVALQTFYRHFGSKDQILIAVLSDLIRGHCETLAARGAALDGPVERLHFYVTDTLNVMVGNPGASGARFMTSQHWRLHQEYPEALAEATKPFADLVQAELEVALAAGVLTPRDPERDAWLINKLVMAVFHHYAFVDDDAGVATIAEEVWEFCLAAVGGAPRARVSSSRRPVRVRGAAK